jgi:hypothetical protein
MFDVGPYEPPITTSAPSKFENSSSNFHGNDGLAIDMDKGLRHLGIKLNREVMEGMTALNLPFPASVRTVLAFRGWGVSVVGD